MKVKWSQMRYTIGYCTTYVSHEEHKGEVIQYYTSFWGTPKVVVKCDDGELRKVSILKCKLI